jgi:hypothetical protein
MAERSVSGRGAVERRPTRPGELLLAARILGVALAVPLITRLRLPRQERILEPRTVPPPDPERQEWLTQNVDRILAAASPLVRPGCLTRGLTHFYFLRRAGADVRLAYGVGEIAGRTEGHCWLVRDGMPFLEREDPRERFVETYSIPRG